MLTRTNGYKIGGTKLLGVPTIPYKSTKRMGTNIAREIEKLLYDWNCLNSTNGMVFDTTTGNTGHKTAACVAIQETFERYLFWFACRHHVGDVILSHVWKSLDIEVSKKPEMSLFERFQESFDKMSQSDIDGFNFLHR